MPIERPVRLTIDILGQYDTNMLQEPYAYPGLGDAGEEKIRQRLGNLLCYFRGIYGSSTCFIEEGTLYKNLERLSLERNFLYCWNKLT